MQNRAEGYLRQLNYNRQMRMNFMQVITILSLLVVLVTFWGLKLTGITMAGEAFCGMEEHTHDETCVVKTLLCEQEEIAAHVHSESCIYRELHCELEEIEPHAHTADCLEQKLICTLPEQEAHVHTQDCKEKNLICGQTEAAAHHHDASCMGNVCGMQEAAAHAHSDSCKTLACTLTEADGHIHDGSCYTLSCGLAETAGHTHSESCRGIVCGLAETEGHSHSDACYAYGEANVCGLVEMEAHTHSAACYVAVEGVYVCGLEETEGHTHSDACYTYGIGFGCGMTEAEGHVHTAECITEETQLGCGLEATEGHTHTDACYEITENCTLEEHIHDATCYSDIDADLETADDWEASFVGLVRTGNTAEDVVTVAKSQLGNLESTANFQVDANGVRRGITRYGQWYGNPYGDWSAMFVSFCLYYAGVEDVPANAGPEAMRLEWEAAGLYKPAAEYAPHIGDVIFLHKEITEEQTIMTLEETGIDEGTEADAAADTKAVMELALDDDKANAVAIITEVTETGITVIEGDVNGTVAEVTYEIDDEAILGYGAVPQASILGLVEAPEGAVAIAKTVVYDPALFVDSNQFVMYTVSGENYYAFDGIGNAVQIYIDEEGNILADVADPDTLLWTLSDSGSSYLIKNIGTGRYMHSYADNGGGVTTTGAYSSTFINSGGGVRVLSNSEYARLDTASGKFVMTRTQNQAAVYQFGMISRATLWLDGTNGGLMSLAGSPNTAVNVENGGTYTLPTTWTSPEKYSYTLRGWYDVTNSTYHIPGDEVIVTGDMVFYADWMASTYNVGQYNSQVADTISTNKFITTRIFDYNPLFNVQSQTVAVTVDESSHSEIWTSASLGNPVPYKEMDSLEFMFLDYDSTGDISYSRNRSNRNISNSVYTGLYTSQLRSILFDPQRDVIGKTYLGTADHLFQYMDDPNDPNYGYYYYDSKLNAASYNRGAGRFYVYDYLERTADSDKDGGAGKYSDFLPFNSPYANTNGKTVKTYTYAGENGEYGGTTHYMYDAKYNTNNNSTGNVGTNYNFGMSIDIDFYLSHVPGERDMNNDTGNRDIYGNEMCFKFSGDDDVWVLVDGKLVLDIGGVHGIESGEINFSTGVITVNGSQIGTLASYGFTDREHVVREHVLTVMYLERGSSQSNCAIYFNLTPRFALTIQKEDVLTQEKLDGAQFSVFMDKNCTKPAELWTSEASHDSDDPPPTHQRIYRCKRQGRNVGHVLQYGLLY